MVVVAPRPEPIQRRHRVPEEVAVAQSAAFLDVDGHAELPARLGPNRGETIRLLIARPRRTLSQNLHLYGAGVTVCRAAYLSRSAERLQRIPGLDVNCRGKRAKLAFRERFVRNPIQYCAAGNGYNVERELTRVVRQRRDVLHRLRQWKDRVRAVAVFSAGV